MKKVFVRRPWLNRGVWVIAWLEVKQMRYRVDLISVLTGNAKVNFKQQIYSNPGLLSEMNQCFQCTKRFEDSLIMTEKKHSHRSSQVLTKPVQPPPPPPWWATPVASRPEWSAKETKLRNGMKRRALPPPPNQKQLSGKLGKKCSSDKFSSPRWKCSMTKKLYTCFSPSSPGFDSRHSQEFFSWCCWDLLTALLRAEDRDLKMSIEPI